MAEAERSKRSSARSRSRPRHRGGVGLTLVRLGEVGLWAAQASPGALNKSYMVDVTQT